MASCPFMTGYSFPESRGRLRSQPDTIFKSPAMRGGFDCAPSHGPLLVNAYVRPPQFAGVTQVPEDYQAFERLQSINRSWFNLYPTNHRTLIRENRSYLVQVQPRPREIDERMLAGQYEWHSFAPSGQWIGRQLLVPQDSIHEIRQQAESVTYYELINDREYEFESFRSANQTFPSAKMIVVGDGSPAQIQVLINGRQAFSEDLVTRFGHFELRDLDFGERGRIKVSCNRFRADFYQW